MQAIRGVRVQIENNHCSIVADSQEGLDEVIHLNHAMAGVLSYDAGACDHVI